MPGVPIIDCLYSLEVLHNSADLLSAETMRSVASEMDRGAISHLLLAPCRRWRCEIHWGPYGISASEVDHYVTANPRRFSALTTYNPHAIRESLTSIEAALANGALGVYLPTEGSDVPLTDQRMAPLFSRCSQLQVPVIIQTGVSMSNIAALNDLRAVAINFNRLKIVAGQCGPIDLPLVLNLCEVSLNINFAFDGCLVFPGDNALFRKSAILRDRVMFGSNGCRWVDLVEGIARLELPYEFMKAFLHDNAARTFGLDKVSSPRELATAASSK